MYSEAVKFTETGRYGCGPEGDDDVYTVEEFRDYCNRKMFVDYDGFGHLVRDKMADPEIVDT